MSLNREKHMAPVWYGDALGAPARLLRARSCGESVSRGVPGTGPIRSSEGEKMIFNPLRDGIEGVRHRIMDAFVIGFAAGALGAFGLVLAVWALSSR